MIEVINEFIQEHQEDWNPDRSPETQLNKLKDIINSESKTFILNGESCAVYDDQGANYGGHEGSKFTLDVSKLAETIEDCLENWWVPVTTGELVDIWLIEEGSL